MRKSRKKLNLNKELKVLVFDIETAPIIAMVWGLWDNNVSLNQIVQDWYVMSWSAKWLGDKPKDTMYMDQRGVSPQKDDKLILEGIWKLLNEADVVITQNGKKFDAKKLNSRFILNGMQPPSSYRHIDTLQIAKKHFAFTSNKLAYMTDKLCVKYKKLDHGKFEGMTLWTECMANNPDAWKEMEKYNRYDVLSLEELYYKLIPYDNSLNFNVYHDSEEHICNCGSTDSEENGFFFSNTGKFQKYKCTACGHETRSKENLLTKEKRDSLRPHTPKK
jgi:DNA polymerase elongation subunit (family B)